MGQADRAGEEKFNLETQSSKLPKEVHAPCIHRRARRRAREGGGRQSGRLGRFFTRDEVPSSRRPRTKPTPPADINSERKLGPLILSIAPSQDSFPTMKIDLIHSLALNKTPPRPASRSRGTAAVREGGEETASGKVALDGSLTRLPSRRPPSPPARAVGARTQVLFIRPLCMEEGRKDMVVHK